ncbi:antibiotic biosynthesis monooxygenase family protein [Mycobacterium sp.]|uniref:antibiotic biosynthesis monooxygenase family protein n=1 Tax=Mycobacterium sp. TaxID=1785 RepID=UPI002D863DC1|nr:hypothetical protein [Mycobacterium sp.]
MIVRTWSARATPTGADSYRNYFEQTLLPELQALPGFSGAVLLSRDDGGLVELTAHTWWESLDAIRAFAGDDLTTAVVEPEALAVLQHSDTTVVHRTVLVNGLI